MIFADHDHEYANYVFKEVFVWMLVLFFMLIAVKAMFALAGIQWNKRKPHPVIDVLMLILCVAFAAFLIAVRHRITF